MINLYFRNILQFWSSIGVGRVYLVVCRVKIRGLLLKPNGFWKSVLPYLVAWWMWAMMFHQMLKKNFC